MIGSDSSTAAAVTKVSGRSHRFQDDFSVVLGADVVFFYYCLSGRILRCNVLEKSDIRSRVTLNFLSGCKVF